MLISGSPGLTNSRRRRWAPSDVGNTISQ